MWKVFGWKPLSCVEMEWTTERCWKQEGHGHDAGDGDASHGYDLSSECSWRMRSQTTNACLIVNLLLQLRKQQLRRCCRREDRRTFEKGKRRSIYAPFMQPLRGLLSLSAVVCYHSCIRRMGLQQQVPEHVVEMWCTAPRPWKKTSGFEARFNPTLIN